MHVIIITSLTHNFIFIFSCISHFCITTNILFNFCIYFIPFLVHFNFNKYSALNLNVDVRRDIYFSMFVQFVLDSGRVCARLPGCGRWYEGVRAARIKQIAFNGRKTEAKNKNGEEESNIMCDALIIPFGQISAKRLSVCSQFALCARPTTESSQA